MEVNALLKRMVEKGASDLHLRVPSPPVLRIDGVLEVQEDLPPVAVKDLEMAFERIATQEHRSRLLKDMYIDFAYSAPGLARFRINVMRQRGTLSIAIRVVPFQVPSIPDLGAPQICQGLVLESKGLLLITGPAASGKSTTMAAMINHLNKSLRRNVIILEDPIEFLHRNELCIIAQRDIGDDAGSMDVALRQSLRHDADVIAIGAMDCAETFGTALRAAESGRLVLATMCTTGAVDTINRLVDVFPADERKLVRQQISHVLIGIVSQRLLNRASGRGRVAAFGVLVNSPQISRLICEGKDNEIVSLMQTGAQGMQTLKQSAEDLVQKNIAKVEGHLLSGGCS